MPIRAVARLKYVSIPPRKMRLVANMIKGMPVEKALDVLNFTPRVAAHHVAKTLKSATANALSREGTTHVRPESLRVKAITVDSAPTAKRIQFQSMGRVFRIRKRYCHLTVVIEEKVERVTTSLAEKAKLEAETGSARGKRTAAPKTKAKKTDQGKAKKTAKRKTSAAKPARKKTTTSKTGAKKEIGRKSSTRARKGDTRAD